jgi:hypothetical protein
MYLPFSPNQVSISWMYCELTSVLVSAPFVTDVAAAIGQLINIFLEIQTVQHGQHLEPILYNLRFLRYRDLLIQ